MAMIRNAMKERLKAGKPVLGMGIAFPSPAVVEFCAYAGLHFVRIDCEHGPMDPIAVEHMVRAAEATGITPFVRPPTNAPHETLRLLDAGALGVLAPGIETREDAELAAQSVRYFPEGKRGLAGVRWARHGGAAPLPELVKQENDAILLLALIESKAGVDNLDDILKVEGVDGVGIGPNDLSQTLGMPAQASNPVVQDHINRVIEKALAAGKYVQFGARDLESAKKLLDRGVQIVELNAGLVFMDACRKVVQAFG